MSLKDPDELGRWKSAKDEAAFRQLVDELAGEHWAPAPHRLDVTTDYGTAVVHHLDGSGEPVVFLPGFGAPALMYRPELVSALAGRPVFLVETIGDVGPSVQSAPIRDAGDEAAWVDQVIAGLGIDQAHLAGTSFGAWLALNLALRHPGRLRSVAAIEPVWARIGLRTALKGLPVLVGAMAPEPIRLRVAARYHQPLLADRRLRRVGRLAYTRHINGHPRPAFLTDDDLSVIEVPLLVLLGADSEISNTRLVGERLGRCTPHATVEVVPDAGHSLPVEHPELVAGRIAAFLRNVETG